MTSSDHKSRLGRVLCIVSAALVLLSSLWACDFERRKYLPARVDSSSSVPRKQLAQLPPPLPTSSPPPTTSNSPPTFDGLTPQGHAPSVLDDVESPRIATASPDSSLPSSSSASSSTEMTISSSEPSKAAALATTAAVAPLSEARTADSGAAPTTSSAFSAASSSSSYSSPPSSPSSSEAAEATAAAAAASSSTPLASDAKREPRGAPAARGDNGASSPDKQQKQAACVAAAGLTWKPHRNRTTVTRWKDLMTTTQWAEEPSGIASRCDWVFGSRASFHGKIDKDSSWGDTLQLPRTIFVRSDAVPFFVTRILPCLSRPFALVTGDSDATLPRQLDDSLPWNMDARVWADLVSNPLVLHVFAENLDAPAPPKVTGIPSGFDLTLGFSGINVMDKDKESGHLEVDIGTRLLEKISLPARDLRARPLKVLDVDKRSLHNQHKGETQLDNLSEHALQVCQTDWREFCEPGALGSGSDETFSAEILREYPFVLVHGRRREDDDQDGTGDRVRGKDETAVGDSTRHGRRDGGGGAIGPGCVLDPGPEAFKALLSGVIPIMRSYPGDHGYRELPVVLVDDWEPASISLDKLRAWREKLAPYFDEPELRAGVLERLHMGYWWDKVEAVLSGNAEVIHGEVLAIDATSRSRHQHLVVP